MDSGRIYYTNESDWINLFTMKYRCGYIGFITIKRTGLICHENLVSKNRDRITSRRYVTAKRYFPKTTRTRKQKLQRT